MYGGPEDAMKKAKNQASSNNINGAIETLEAYLVNDPHNVEVRMLLANIAFNAMMHNYAIMQLNIIVDLDPDNEDARRALLTIYKNDKKTVRQANEQFQYLLEKHPEDPDLLNSYGYSADFSYWITRNRRNTTSRRSNWIRTGLNSTSTMRYSS